MFSEEDIYRLSRRATLKKDQKLVFMTNYHLMQGKIIAECKIIAEFSKEHSAILSTFI